MYIYIYHIIYIYICTYMSVYAYIFATIFNVCIYLYSIYTHTLYIHMRICMLLVKPYAYIYMYVTCKAPYICMLLVKPYNIYIYTYGHVYVTCYL